MVVFFFQAEDGIRDLYVTGVQTCALPILNWGLGWEVWCDGMEVTQFTYFQQVGGFECRPVTGELTYGLERLAMYIQGVDNVFDLRFNNEGVTYGDVFRENEVEMSEYHFEVADTESLFDGFRK